MSNDSKFIDYSVLLADLYAKRAGIDAAIQGVIAASGSYITPEAIAAATPGASVDRQPTELPRGAFLGKSLPAAVKLYLSAVMKKQTIKEIASALRDGGVESTSDNFESVITGCLNRMKGSGEVLRFKEGWALAEFYPEHLRRSLAAGGNGKPKATAKKGKKATPKPAKTAKPAPGIQESLEARIEAYARDHTGGVITFKQVADALPGTLPSVVSLSLGRIAKKRGWHKTTDGGYHIMGKVQEMAKAV
jgi:hypothetical protein